MIWRKEDFLENRFRLILLFVGRLAAVAVGEKGGWSWDGGENIWESAFVVVISP